jgi:hypothetical protein
MGYFLYSQHLAELPFFATMAQVNTQNFYA